MTVIESKEECIKMWTWIRDNTGQEAVDRFIKISRDPHFNLFMKKLYALEYPKSNEWKNHCALCDTFQVDSAYHILCCCAGCPLSNEAGRYIYCENYGEAYHDWKTEPSFARQRALAQQIIDKVRASL